MSELGNLIITSGPYAGGHRMSEILARVVDRTEINALRDELIELRAIAAEATAGDRIDVMADADGERSWITLACDRCQWNADIDDPVSLRDLNQRAQEHAEVCR